MVEGWNEQAKQEEVDLNRCKLSESYRERLESCELDPECYLPGSRVHFRNVKPQLQVSFCDLVNRRDNKLEVEIKPSFYFGLMTEGASSTFHFDGGKKHELRPLVPVLGVFGEPVTCTGYQKSNARCSSIGVTMQLDFVRSLALEYKAEVLSEVLEQADSRVLLRKLQKTSQLSTIVRNMLCNSFNCPLANLQLESCILALIVEITRALSNEKNEQLNSGLSRREIRRAHLVRDLLEESIVNPPSLSQLSREVGINPTTMSAHFRKVFGDSIFSYLRGRRLEVAQNMLRTRELSISQVGYQVGFSNAAAFTTAYKKHFGYPPSNETMK